VDDVNKMISQLEQQRGAIDRALSALRELAGTAPTAKNNFPGLKKQSPARGKRRMSPEGLARIIVANRKRWAVKRAAGAPKRAAAPSRSRRGTLSAEGRERLALAMKKRWAAAKKAGKKQLA
jgi:hypothetical protein